MPFPTKLLNNDEEIVLDLRPHWWYLAPASAALAGTVILGVVVLVADVWDPVKWLVGLLVLAALGYFVQRYVRWAGENFVVTSERVIHRSGVIAKKGIEIPLERINTVFFNQSLFERLLGAGDLGVESAGESGRQNFSNIRKPAGVQQSIYRAMEEVQARDLRKMGEAVAGARPASLSIPEQIEQLDELRRRGVLSDAEFEAKKRDLLDRM
ncbi:MAG: PH domain-containing protein [Acidimicrobiales bacterium]|nr:PH domain-containing protein [Acidimicrobiales bacterium]